jgi:diguanylate cyclase (GGDEF)-like protein
MMLVIGGMPLYLYLDSTFHVFRHRVIRWLCVTDLAYLALATAFQYLGLWDYHQTLNGAVATYGIVPTILLICVFHQRREARSEQHPERRLFQTLQRIGILLLGLGLLGDLLRYLTADVMDRAFNIRIGLLLFIVFFGAGNIYQMVLLVQKGHQAEFISNLAYSDGLTGIGNRTAYIERLRECAEKAPNKPLGIVMFDINCLKEINDTMGHKVGDEMIRICTDYMRESFECVARLYRIGGDEFVALLEGENQQANYREALHYFTESLVKWNAQPDALFRLVVASGVAFSDTANKASVELAEKEADFAMYENKYDLKHRDYC